LLREKIKTTLNQDAPVAIAKGNAIAKGVNAELDELRASLLREGILGRKKTRVTTDGISS
jgi:DNA mismatch repair protein MutS